MEFTKMEKEELTIALKNKIYKLEQVLNFEMMFPGKNNIMDSFDKLKNLRALLGKINKE